MEITTFYDSEGRAVCYLDDDGTSIFLHDGSPVAWVSEQGIHTCLCSLTHPAIIDPRL